MSKSVAESHNYYITSLQIKLKINYKEDTSKLGIGTKTLIMYEQIYKTGCLVPCSKVILEKLSQS
jgi:hypothetical protein